MPGTGTTTVDFGTYPGKPDASVVVTGQAGILTTSMVEAYINPKATASHSEDEHIIEKIGVFVPSSLIIAGTGFTIKVQAYDRKLYGLYTVNWVWV